MTSFHSVSLLTNFLRTPTGENFGSRLYRGPTGTRPRRPESAASTSRTLITKLRGQTATEVEISDRWRLDSWSQTRYRATSHFRLKNAPGHARRWNKKKLTIWNPKNGERKASKIKAQPRPSNNSDHPKEFFSHSNSVASSLMRMEWMAKYFCVEVDRA